MKKKFWYKKSVLITGATGFIGANLTRELVELGADVHIFTKATSDKWRIKDILNHITEHRCNLKNQNNIQKIVKKINPHIIYHLATHGSRPFQKNLNEIIKTNIIGTDNLLRALLDINYQCFVNTGTSSEYGLKDKPMKEADLLEPISIYAATKASTTLLCQVFAKLYKKPIITLRLFSVYGYYEHPNRLIPTAIISSLTGKPLKLTSGKQRHDFIFIDDVIETYLRVPFIKNISGEIINIGSGKQYSNEEVASKINKLSEKGLKIEKDKYLPRSWDTDYWVANIKKARKLLGWKPKFSFEQGLKKTISWFKENLQIYQDVSK